MALFSLSHYYVYNLSVSSFSSSTSETLQRWNLTDETEHQCITCTSLTLAISRLIEHIHKYEISESSSYGTEKVNVIELPPNTHFIFVHGFGSGGWSWFKIQKLMKEAGYKVSCPDLKSAGIDPTNATSISTIEEYDEPLFHLLAASPENETIVLVGTSAGGVSLTHMIHTFPEKIHMAIFVAATMLRNGFLTKQDREIGLPNVISQPKCGESTSKAINTSQEKELACLLQKPGPIDALIRTNFKEEKRVDKVKRVYIKAMRDLSLDPLKQQAMIEKWPPLAAFYLDSDHAPNLSKHVELFKLLVGAAALI